MKPEILNFIQKERVCSLSVIIADNTPHSATVHYSSQADPLKFYIQTSDKTTKAKPFFNGRIGNASIVIGQSEKDWVTFQMRGLVRMVTSPEELEKVYKIHYQKHPDAEQYKGPHTVFLEFSPTWWRYTDFNTEPETIVENKL
jgi:uncharacterized protein YhbP (UPF0306 family)